MADENTTVLRKLIEAELSWLRSAGFIVSDQDELPQGWVQVDDGHERWYGIAGEILESLKAALNVDSEHRSIFTVYEALEIYAGRNLQGADTWYDYREYIGVQIEGFGLIMFQTNGGSKWGFAPTGIDLVAFNNTHNFSPWYEHACEALDAACDFVACRKSDMPSPSDLPRDEIGREIAILVHEHPEIAPDFGKINLDALPIETKAEMLASIKARLGIPPIRR